MTVFPRSGALALVAALALGGCAAPANKDAMVPRAPAAALKQQPYSVGVVARGGAETSSVGSSNISDADLKASIESAIKEARLFREVLQAGGGDYELTVVITQVSKPSFGLGFTVTLETGWTLARVADRRIVLRKVITATHTATTGEAFVAARRLQLAVEGAARKSIEQGLAAISDLSL